MNTRIVKYEADGLFTAVECACKVMPFGNTLPRVYRVSGKARQLSKGNSEIVCELRVYEPQQVRSLSSSKDVEYPDVIRVKRPLCSKFISTGKVKPRSAGEPTLEPPISSAVVISSTPDHVPTRFSLDGWLKKTCVGTSSQPATARAASKAKDEYLISTCPGIQVTGVLPLPVRIREIRAMNLVLAIACDAATVSPQGKLDVSGIYNELSAPDFPAAQDRMTVVFVLEWSAREAGEQPIRADLIGPDGSMVVTVQGHTDVELGPDNEIPPQTRMILPFDHVVFPQPGRYFFRLQAGEETLETLPLYVSRMR